MFFFARIHLSQTELVSLNGPRPCEYFTFAHDFRPLRANHLHKLKPLLVKLNSFKFLLGLCIYATVSKLWEAIAQRFMQTKKIG